MPNGADPQGDYWYLTVRTAWENGPSMVRNKTGWLGTQRLIIGLVRVMSQVL